MKFKSLTKITGIFSALFLMSASAQAATVQFNADDSVTLINTFIDFQIDGKTEINNIHCEQRNSPIYVCTYLPVTGKSEGFGAYQLWPISAYRVGSTLSKNIAYSEGRYSNRYGVSFRTRQIFVNSLKCDMQSCVAEIK